MNTCPKSFFWILHSPARSQIVQVSDTFCFPNEQILNLWQIPQHVDI